ncbi:hypothetical protein RN001_003515 [Aquatica leii]|uniref:Uncharacterized protein n=1 Tax=Aquatica leii TaxID=1421715 RepID=A0AAN7PIF5_9COLE|nr:hypothetical protein RN001_003515 [Aquatica leii]
MASSRVKRLVDLCELNHRISPKKQKLTCPLKLRENNVTTRQSVPDPPTNIKYFDIMSMPIDILEDAIISDQHNITNIENHENCEPKQRIDNPLNSDSKNTENGEDINITLEMGNNKTRENVKKINKILREKGKSYLGHRRLAGQSRTFQDTQRSERKIGLLCNSKFCKKSSKRQPGRKTGDPTVNDIRVLEYLPEGQIKYKIPFDNVYTDLPIRPTAVQPVVFPRLFKERLLIKNTKFDHLQQLKPVIPSDCRTFYDKLPHSDK